MNVPSPTDTDRRTAILDAAVESFGKLGYYGTSLQRIATEVGLTKAGVLHYVGSKEGLLDLALTEEYDRVTESINAAMVAQERPLIADMWRQGGGGEQQAARAGAHVLHAEHRGT